MAIIDKNSRRYRRSVRRLVLLCLLSGVFVTLWQFVPIAEMQDPTRLGSWLNGINNSPWAGPISIAAFLVGSLIVFPVTALIAAAGIALGPVEGLVWAFFGSMLAAIMNYGIARMLPAEVLDDWIGLWIRRLGMRFERSSIVSIMVARNIPIAPFTLVNVVAGAAGIRFRDYVIGTILGMGPMIAALTVLGDRLRGAIEAPTVGNMVLLCTAIVVWVVIGLSLQMISNRLLAQRRGSQ